MPGPPSDVQPRSSSSANSLQFTWRPPARANGGPILEYRVAVALDLSYNPDRAKFSEKSLRISNTTTSATQLHAGRGALIKPVRADGCPWAGRGWVGEPCLLVSCVRVVLDFVVVLGGGASLRAL